jgi:hypothetical protein
VTTTTKNCESMAATATATAKTKKHSLSETLLQGGRGSKAQHMLLLSLRRLPLCNLSAASSLRSRKQASAARGSMGSALGAPKAAAEEGKRRSTSSLPIADASAEATEPSSPSPSPSSSPVSRLLESPATERALLPKKTPLGERFLLSRREKTEKKREKRLKRGKLNLDLDLVLVLSKKKKKRQSAPSHRSRRPRPRVRGQSGQGPRHHRRRRPWLRRGAQGAPRQARAQRHSEQRRP